MYRIGFLLNTLLVLIVVKNVYVEGLGVNWGAVTTHPLPYKNVIQMLKDNGISKVKLFDSDPNILKALAGSGLEVMVAVGNGQLKDLGDIKAAKDWVKENITNHNPTSSSGVNITMVGVGNEPFLKDYKDMFVNVTGPALQNMQKALDEAGHGHIKATVPFNADVYYSPNDNPFPSAGMFRPDIRDPIVDIIKMLAKNQAPFMVNIYPFLSLFYGKGQFPFDFAFFDGASPLVDKNGNKYTNVFDANLDTLASALKTEGYGNVSIIVGEMGWPTDGDVNANTTLASRFYNGLMKKFAENKGSPLLKENTEVYLFGLFDENSKSILPGNFERHWGIFTFDGQVKFDLDLSGGKSNKSLIPTKGVEYLQKKWCTLKPDSTDKARIEESIKYACDRADCTALETGGSCNSLDPNGHASYAFNAYYQATNQAGETCDFNGLATVTTKNVSEGHCRFDIQIVPQKNTDNSSALTPPPQGSPSGNNKSSASVEKPLKVGVSFLAMFFISLILV